MTANPNGATLRELRTLNDLDLGALAYNTRIAGEPLTPADLDVICAAYTANPDGYRAVLTATRGHKFVFAQGARELAALGAKVRAALPQEPNPLQARLDALQRRIDADALRWGPSNLAIADVEGARQALAELRDGPASTAPLADQIRALPRPAAPTKPVPRVLQSADEAPRGSLLRRSTTQTLTLRLWNGCGWNLEGGGRLSDWNGWQWDISKDEPCTLIAEGLTEDECRHMSGLSAADALAWCEKRQAALHVPTTCDKATTYWLQVAKERAESTAATKGGVLEATRTALRTEPGACIIRTAEQVRALADEALQVHAGAAAKARGEVAAREELKPVVPAPAAPGKPRPQPGDAVPWAEVEAGALYSDTSDDAGYPFLACMAGGDQWMEGPADDDLEPWLRDNGVRSGGRHGSLGKYRPSRPVLVARDLGSDPEAWRRAMREWTANGNRPTPKPAELASAGGIDYAATHAELAAAARKQYPEWDITSSASGVTFTAPRHNGAGASITPAPAANVPADLVGPLRQVGVLNRGALTKATPERVVEMAVERLDALKRQVRRLKTANEEARTALETPGRQGLRARLAKAEAKLEALTLAEPKVPSWQRVKIHTLEAEAVTRRAELEKVKADLQKANQHHACSVFALAAQRDEARRALADEKVKTSALVRPLRLAMGWLPQTTAAPEAVVEIAATALQLARREAVQATARAEKAEEVVTSQGHDLVRLRALLDGRLFFPAEVLEPLRALVPASAVNAEQVVAAVVADLRAAPMWRGDSATLAKVEKLLGCGTTNDPTVFIKSLQNRVAAAEERAEKAEASTALWAAKCDLVKTLRVEVARQTDRAEKAERNLRAAADLLAA